MMTNKHSSQDVIETARVTSELDSPTAEFLEGFSKFFASLANLSISEQRATLKEMSNIPENQLEPIAKTENKTVNGRHGPIPIRLFSPNSHGTHPIIVYLHHGGWVYGSLQESEAICRKLANQTGAIVAAIEYRLSPEDKYPVPLEDCYDATKWIVENAASFSGNPYKVILCGESAGGNMAASIALMLQDTKEFTVAGQLLIYPILTSDLKKRHYDESPDKALISYENMQFFWDAYLSSSEEGKSHYVSPLNSENKNLTKLPSCFIITAEHDALKHEGAQYAKVLQNAGVAVQSKCYPNVIHGFLGFPLADPVKKEAIRDIVTWVKRL